MLTASRLHHGESLGSDACWDSYLRVLAGDPRFGSTLESWLVLQHASDRCHAAGISGRAVSCGDWSRLSPLQPAYRLDVLCAPSCVWPRSLAPAALDLINSTLPHADKATFCSRRADNTYCAALAASSTDACTLLRDGCALYYEAHYLAFIGDAEAFARERDACERAHTRQTAFEPVPIALTPLGDATLSEIWHSTRSVVSQLDSSSSSGASSSQPSSSSAAAASFSRVLYNVTIDSTSYTASGLLVEPISSTHPMRGVFLYFHGTMAAGDTPLSDTPILTTPRSFRTMEHTLLATLTQLGYTVLAPDDLGIGSHTTAPDQAYLNHRILSTVAVEMLRGVQTQRLTQSPMRARYRAGRRPELHLLGGSHGGYLTAAVQRRLQEDTTLSHLFVVSGSFIHAAPLDASGVMLQRLVDSSRPYPLPLVHATGW